MSANAKVLINAQYASTSNNDEYMATNVRTIIDKFTATNVSAASATLSVYLVPQGETAELTNLIIKDLSIAAGATEDLSKLQNQILASGDSIVVSSGTADSIVIRASGRECT